MITVKKEIMFKKAEDAFEDFKIAMKQKLGSEIRKEDEPIAKALFVNGFMKGIDTVVKLGQS